MTIRLAYVLIPLAVITAIGADTLGVAATLLTICVIVGFAVAASAWTVSGGTAWPPSTRPPSPDE
ncbi:hypothetical protein [Bradyrhizobium sp. UFLA03-84]|uniref:hypothetical protein n=1 Tax=Bradyrhizobium sp. UFLA03-84 TaxID=418599 RepID=UPI0011782AE1|nr:hypothetical protein [Bradyrhizobium sp. UFLA03-84]